MVSHISHVTLNSLSVARATAANRRAPSLTGDGGGGVEDNDVPSDTEVANDTTDAFPEFEFVNFLANVEGSYKGTRNTND